MQVLRLIGGAVVGVISWFVIVIVFDFLLRFSWHDYAVVERAMTFTLPMMAARLSESAISSLLSGLAAATVDRGRWAALLSGLILFAYFLYVHYGLWNKFPVWYHLTFLISLPLLSYVGSLFVEPKPAAA
jgi:hypothetical protein